MLDIRQFRAPGRPIETDLTVPPLRRDANLLQLAQRIRRRYFGKCIGNPVQTVDSRLQASSQRLQHHASETVRVRGRGQDGGPAAASQPESVRRSGENTH